MKDNEFTDYRAAGCNISSLTGLLQEGAFMQCLFEGKSVVNNGYFYALPKTYETPAYTQYRNAPITQGVCKLRDQTIKGEITAEVFFERFNMLKQQGLQRVIDEASKAAGQ